MCRKSSTAVSLVITLYLSLQAFTDHSDLVARRMGFIPLPLGVVMLRVLGHTVQIHGAAGLSLAVLAFLCVTSFKILNSVLLLGIACDLVNQHQQVTSKTVI